MEQIMLNSKSLLLFILQFLFYCHGTAQPDGSSIYRQYCGQCHGSDLKGGNATSLVDGVWQFGAEDNYVMRNIKHGIPHLGMPSYERSLTDEEIRSVVQYIRTAEQETGVTKPPIPEVVETLDYFMKVEIS